MTVGDPIVRTKEPLSVELGPGILSTIFDGIQRPLKVIAEGSQSIFIPKGVEVHALDRKKLWEFVPEEKLKIGSILGGGDFLGCCFENNLFDEHRILLPPKAKGRVTWMAPAGHYNIKEKMIELEFDGKKYEYSMSL